MHGQTNSGNNSTTSESTSETRQAARNGTSGFNLIGRYTRWLHTKWPAGLVEKLPEVNLDGTTGISGLFVCGDLTGVPLLKFAADSGVKCIQKIWKELQGKPHSDGYDVVIVGGGVSGIAAAVEAKKLGMKFVVYEATQSFSTIINFPKGKPIYTYPADMTPAGELQMMANVKEGLVEELEFQQKKFGIQTEIARVTHVQKKSDGFEIKFDGKTPTKARAVVIAIGRSGNFRKIGCPGETLPKVYNRLHDPKEYKGQNVLVVGGGDSALEAAIALADAGAKVTLSYRKKEFARPKPENAAAIKMLPIKLELGSNVSEIRDKEVILKLDEGSSQSIPNDVVFPLIGREPPLDFFRRSGISIRGEWNIAKWATFIGFFSFCVFVYLWKGGTSVNKAFEANGWFPFNIDKGSPWRVTFREPGFYYSLLYTLCVVVFGFKRMAKRRTAYVKWQTLSLMAFQIFPLFLLPYFILPYMGHWGWFDAGTGKKFADEFFPAAGYGHGREYWRAFGFVLAWPLFIWNLFTSKPMWGWLIVSLIQTFVIVPLIVWRWGKGAYCGWICSCGALAETLGDAHRGKMPHGPFWNRLNMVGQAILGVAFLLLGTRVYSWIFPAAEGVRKFHESLLYGLSFGGVSFDYYHVVDIGLAGIVGVGLYFHFSGRVWCRFACPLAALMHIYARFSRFRIFAQKEKCISCNVCTSVCHQGIDIMSFANKGLPMEDPECVRCSACVQTCPTQVLTFGRYGSNKEIIYDRLAAK